MKWKAHIREGLRSNYSYLDIAWFLMRLPLTRYMLPKYSRAKKTIFYPPLYFLHEIEYRHLKDYQHIASPITVILNKLRGIKPTYITKAGQVIYAPKGKIA